MTARNGKAEWHGSVEGGSGTITVGDGVFEGAYSYETRVARAGWDPRDRFDGKAAHCRLHQRTGAERPMSTNDQRAVRSGRARTVSFAVARRSRRVPVVLEYLRSHDRFAEPGSASRARQGPDLGVDQGVRS
jgi:hypothetical protein